MPFALTNAPSTFMRLMNKVLKEYAGNIVIVYLDDILVFSKSKEEHLEHLKLVLRTLQKEKLLRNLKKCSFMKEEIIYLGFVVSKEGLKINLEKVQEIWNWPIPRNISEKTIHSFKWTEATDRNFKLLKRKITEEPLLALLDFEKVFQVETDASRVTVGAVLSQEQRSITYFSENLNEAKKKYSSYDKEFYAIVQVLKKWRHYLLPKESILYTDNHAL
eukprot:PITA_07693